MASASQHTLVDLVCALSTLQTDSVLQLVKEVVKRPAQIKGDEVRFPGEGSIPWGGEHTLGELPAPDGKENSLGCKEDLLLCVKECLQTSGAAVSGSYLRSASLSLMSHTLPGAQLLAPSRKRKWHLPSGTPQPARCRK